jgi:prephenate dehydrogenase
METVQAGAHAAVLAYALAAREVRPEFHTPVSTALAEAAEAVTGGTPRVYREIQATFDGADRVAEAAARVAAAAGDDGAFDDLYRAASAAVDSAHAAGAAAEDAESGDADTGERGGSDRSAPGGDGRD